MSFQKGREPTKEDRRRHDAGVMDRAARAASYPTGRPRPDWMQDPLKLPREPPGGKRRNSQ